MQRPIRWITLLIAGFLLIFISIFAFNYSAIPVPRLIGYNDLPAIATSQASESLNKLAVVVDIKGFRIVDSQSFSRSFTPLMLNLVLRFTNISYRPFWFHKPGAVGFDLFSGCPTDVVGHLFSEQGQPYEVASAQVDCFNTGIPQSDSDFVVLHPNESFVNSADVWFPVLYKGTNEPIALPPGKYRLAFTYRNTWIGYDFHYALSTPPANIPNFAEALNDRLLDHPTLVDLNAWVGTVTSPQVTIEVPPN